LEQYEVIFLDDDKVTVLEQQFVAAGSPVKYKGKTPAKEPVNGVNYTFVGWEGEEKMNAVNEKLVLVAKYAAETATASKDENALLQASLENAENTNLNATIEAGQKVSEQQKAFAKETRSAEEIVNDIKENGKTEIGIEANKDNIER
jgi:hypothetical protein